MTKKEIEVEELYNDFHEDHAKKRKKLRLLIDSFLIEEKEENETDFNFSNIIPKEKKKLIIREIKPKQKKGGLF